MRSLGSIDHFIVGAVGEPGRRTFLLEIADGADREWFLIEKEQAAAMAERGLALLRELDIRVAQPGPVLGDVGEPTFRGRRDRHRHRRVDHRCRLVATG